MSAKVIKYVGRTTDFKGKSLWEIVGCLKNFGVGRVVVRSVFERYPEPSFMRIVKVETCPDEVSIINSNLECRYFINSNCMKFNT